MKYDPDNRALNYTIDTTGGKLNINYALLEGMIYYLRETVAPENYKLGTTVYVICDDEETAAKAQSMMKDRSMDISEEEVFSYAGKINSEQALKIKVVNKPVETTPPTNTNADPHIYANHNTHSHTYPHTYTNVNTYSYTYTNGNAVPGDS